MKRKHTRSRREISLDEPKLDLSSLVDVSFLLLIFFLVATTITRQEKDLTTAFPSPLMNGQFVPEVLKFTIAKNGGIFLKLDSNSELIEPSGGSSDLSEMRARLSLIRDVTGEEPLVQITTHQEAPYQRFVDVVNGLNAERIKKVTFTDDLQ